MKKIFIAAVLTVATAMGGFLCYNENDADGLSDIAKANIEALANEMPDCLGGCRDIGWGFNKILECDCEYDYFSFFFVWGCF